MIDEIDVQRTIESLKNNIAVLETQASEKDPNLSQELARKIRESAIRLERFIEIRTIKKQ
jgi:histidinol phosphatase-like PHP family hydrolase